MESEKIKPDVPQFFQYSNLDSESHSSVYTNGIDNAQPIYRKISNLPSN